jgi:anti-anti-sigma factor
VNGKILVGDHDGVYVIRFEGDVRVTLCGSFDHYLEQMLHNPGFESVLVDLSGAVGIDSTSLGVLAKLSLGVQEVKGKLPTLVCTSPDIRRILLNMGFDDVFAIVDEDYDTDRSLGELAISNDMAIDEMRERVIEAHRVLMSLNDENEAAFKDLVTALEAEAEAAGENGRKAS